MKNYFKLTIVMIMVCASLAMLALPALALTPAELQKSMTKNLSDVGTEFGQDASGPTLQVTIGRFVKLALSFLGVVVVIIIIYAGFLWMTAGGNEEQVKKAKSWMTNAVIGLVIVLSAYAIADFAIAEVFEATSKV